MDEHLELLDKYKFKKQLKKLENKLKDKKILIYGSGIFFKKIQDNYDLSKLNIVAISDKKYSPEDEYKKDFGYNIVANARIFEQEIDYILIATLNTYNIYQSFKKRIVNEKSKIKVLPLVEKPFFDLLAEVF